MITFEDVQNKTILAGLTYVGKNNEVVKQLQVYGKVVGFKKDIGIEILKHKGHESFNLPPDLGAIQPAPNGEYHLSSTGETVVNPDFISTWTIYEGNKHE
ncbi:MAG: hypothetical protein LBL58_15415 [Tannerellaceae bacterium]|jgi:hypothetical protein|nr:hypothetical protein [Tannerellaceae bacterium]